MREYCLLIINRKISNPVFGNQLEDFPEAITCVLIDTDGGPLKFRRIYDLEEYIQKGEGLCDIIENVTAPFQIYPVSSGNHMRRDLVFADNEPLILGNEVYF